MLSMKCVCGASNLAERERWLGAQRWVCWCKRCGAGVCRADDAGVAFTHWHSKASSVRVSLLVVQSLQGSAFHVVFPPWCWTRSQGTGSDWRVCWTGGDVEAGGGERGGRCGPRGGGAHRRGGSP
eukprot:496020-Rhodomonas_salina.1